MLHQNCLTGKVPQSLSDLGCIVNLAGNANLDLGGDVPAEEREVLLELFHCTNGGNWENATNWASRRPVATWYKVGTLGRHVHRYVGRVRGEV